MFRFPVVAVLILTLAACSPTTYGPMTSDGGYSDLQLSSNAYRVTVSGNARTSQERVVDIALLRAAELTKAAGKARFVVVENNIDSQSHEIVVAPGRQTTTVFADRAVTTYSDPQISTVTKSGGSIVIEMVASGDSRFASAYDAQLLIDQLRPRLEEESPA